MKIILTPKTFLAGLCLITLAISSTACRPKYWDLTGTISAPATAEPGEQLGQKIVVTVINSGLNISKPFAIDLVLSSDKTIPVELASPGKTFSEDMLLLGGREMIPSLYANQTMTVPLNGTNLIPDDTPLGDYYLGVVVDAGEVIQEDNENNNIALTPLKVCAHTAAVTSVNLIEASGGSVGYARMRLGWLYDNGEKPQSMTITIFRETNGAWLNIMPNDLPFDVPDPVNTTQADVTIFQLFSARHRAVFAATYSCDRQIDYVFEFDT